METGFLPARGSLMLDFVALAMIAVTIVMLCSLYLVRYKRWIKAHRWIQVITAAVLLLAVLAFEIDVRFFTKWRELAQPSPYYASGIVDGSLWIHLAFALPTPFLWGGIIYQAHKNYQRAEVADKQFWQRHRWHGRIGTAMMLMTAITGWAFYWLAFVAS